jgi:(1->4)-alpha-D-glucan 1-alpha-D-glucosylmutase
MRAARARLFASGGYVPLQVEGDRKDHVFAYARICDGDVCIVIVPRWAAKLMQGATNLPLGAEVWGDTKVVLGAAAKASFRDAFSARELRSEGEGEGQSLRVAEVLSKFPVAVLKSTA